VTVAKVSDFRESEAVSLNTVLYRRGLETLAGKVEEFT